MGFGQARNSEIYVYITGAFPSMAATSIEVAVYIHNYLNDFRFYETNNIISALYNFLEVGFSVKLIC